MRKLVEPSKTNIGTSMFLPLGLSFGSNSYCADNSTWQHGQRSSDLLSFLSAGFRPSLRLNLGQELLMGRTQKWIKFE